MSVDKELRAYLFDSLRDLSNKERDINIILFYYGFGDDNWPTLESVAKCFNINSRQQVEQILKNKFKNNIDVKTMNLPVLNECVELLNSFSFVSGNDFKSELIRRNYADDSFSPIGFLNLLNDLKLCSNYGIYSPRLKKLTRGLSDECSDFLFIDNNKYDIKVLKKDLKKMETMPGLIGVSNINFLENEIVEFHNKKQLLSRILEIDNSFWIKKINNEIWYVSEERDYNTIINFSRKVFSRINGCNVDTLAEVYRNALLRRSNKYNYPEPFLIKDYLSESAHFYIDGEVIRFNGNISSFTDIENDIYDYLNANDDCEYIQIKKHLLSKGYSKPLIDKSVFRSPFIVVNREHGRQYYKYSLINNIDNLITDNEASRYEEFRKKMVSYLDSGTDSNSESIIRNEQSILRQWLFSGKCHEKCAICGNEFTITSLVTAHKKKRSICKESERVDPYIVMPVCKFGCDHLYENEYVYVNDGVVTLNNKIDGKTHDFIVAKSLDGRKIDAKWLKGKPTYFYVPKLGD